MWFLIGLSVVMVALDLEGFGDNPALRIIDQIVALLFLVEIVLRVGSFRPKSLDFYELDPPHRIEAHILGRFGYCMQPLTLIDIIAVLSWVPALRGLRALRLLRLLRSTLRFRYSSPILSVQRALQDNALLYGFAVSFVGAVTILGGLSIYLVEGPGSPTPHEAILSIADGIWWALVTLTTVGFGDIAPRTGLGRVIAGVLMLTGMFTLALFAGIVGNTLLRAVLSIRQEQFRMSTELNHVVICGYSQGSRMLLDALLEEINFDHMGVTIFAPGDRPIDLPPQFRFVEGDPTKDSELAKARVNHALAVVVVGERGGRPQIADATTILTVFTIRRFMASNPTKQPRKKPLYIVAEVLEAENVDHAKSSGADEVIESTRMGFSVLAHAINHHGTGHVMEQFASASTTSVFMAHIPKGVEAPISFGQLAAKLREDHSMLLIGFRRDGEGEGELNPADDATVSKNDDLIYLAESAIFPPS